MICGWFLGLYFSRSLVCGLLLILYLKSDSVSSRNYRCVEFMFLALKENVAIINQAGSIGGTEAYMACMEDGLILLSQATTILFSKVLVGIWPSLGSILTGDFQDPSVMLHFVPQSCF